MKNRILILLFLPYLLPLANAQTTSIYVSDAGNFDQPPWQILKYDANGENPEVFIDDHLGWPQDIVFLEGTNTVLISNLNDNQIARFNATTGAYIDDFATGISGPTRMKISEDGLLYALQWSGNGKVFRYELDGTFVDEFTEVGLGSSIGLDWDSEGNLYVSSYGQSIIRKYGPEGEDLGVFIDSNISGPTNIWFAENGHLFVLNWGGTTVSEFDADGGFVGSFISGLGQPEGIAFMENGNLLIGNGLTGAVKMYTADGTYLEDLVPSGSGGLIRPNAVVLREEFASSTSEVISEKAFIFPAQGMAFYLKEEYVSDFSDIRIYDVSGKLIRQTKPGENALIWSAENHAAGIYIITGHTAAGKVFRQRIVVQR